MARAIKNGRPASTRRRTAAARQAEAEQQKLFEPWDFIHPGALKREGEAILAGIATEATAEEDMEEVKSAGAGCCAVS